MKHGDVRLLSINLKRILYTDTFYLSFLIPFWVIILPYSGRGGYHLSCSSKSLLDRYYAMTISKGKKGGGKRGRGGGGGGTNDFLQPRKKCGNSFKSYNMLLTLCFIFLRMNKEINKSE